MRFALLAGILSIGIGVPMAAQAKDDPFDLVEIPGTGRVVAAELVDLDGDGRTDVLELAFVGFPPDEKRWIRVYRQSAEGGLPQSPTNEWPIPEGAAAYDLAAITDDPGVELLLLDASGLKILSLAGSEPVIRELPVPGPPTLAASEDERGLDRLRIFRPEFGDPWLLVPLPGRAVALSIDGKVQADLHVGVRSNYLVPPNPGPLVFESEIQVYVDAPRISIGDVDGDGRIDLVASGRHDVRVFLRRPDGRFAQTPDRVIPLARISERDHIRGSGAMRVDLQDVNGDGRIDVLISHVSGSIADAHTRTSIHLNRHGDWDLGTPDREFETKGAWTTDQLIDLDADGHPELVRVAVPLSVLELIEALVTRELDSRWEIYRGEAGGSFGSKPWVKKKLDVPFSFETYRPRGFIATVQEDLNGDGQRDLVASGSGDHIEVYLGGPERRFKRRDARQRADSRGRAGFGDFDGDGLRDIILFDPRRPDAGLRIALNRGILPGTVRDPRFVSGDSSKGETP